MQNEITIQPANDIMKDRVKALQLMNGFVALGFQNRQAFLAIVSHYFPKYKTTKEKTRLSNWHYGKISENTINNDIEIVLNKLKNE